MARSTTHRYIQELSDRDLLDYGRGILSAPESAKMKTAYIAAPLVGSIYCGSPEEEEENVEEYVSLPVSLFGKKDYEGRLVGIIRAVGDGASILFIQDIIVLPEFQRKGIGTDLLRAIIRRYPDVYQTELMTDNTDKTIAFYKSLGFTPATEFGCLGFMKLNT